MKKTWVELKRLTFSFFLYSIFISLCSVAQAASRIKRGNYFFYKFLPYQLLYTCHAYYYFSCVCFHWLCDFLCCVSFFQIHKDCEYISYISPFWFTWVGSSLQSFTIIFFKQVRMKQNSRTRMSSNNNKHILAEHLKFSIQC